MKRAESGSVIGVSAISGIETLNYGYIEFENWFQCSNLSRNSRQLQKYGQSLLAVSKGTPWYLQIYWNVYWIRFSGTFPWPDQFFLKSKVSFNQALFYDCSWSSERTWNEDLLATCQLWYLNTSSAYRCLPFISHSGIPVHTYLRFTQATIPSLTIGWNRKSWISFG